MNVIKTDKFRAHCQEMKSSQLTSKLDKLQNVLEAETNPMTPILLTKSRKFEGDIYVYRMAEYRLFWTVVGNDILFVDISLRSRLSW